MERISKVIANAGVISRRGADELIKSGKVLVNGEIAILGQKVDNNDIFIEDNFENRYKTSIEWGVCLFDVTTLKFYLGKIEELYKKYTDYEYS